MAVEKTIPKDKKHNAIDMLVGELHYDEEARL